MSRLSAKSGAAKISAWARNVEKDLKHWPKGKGSLAFKRGLLAGEFFAALDLLGVRDSTINFSRIRPKRNHFEPLSPLTERGSLGSTFEELQNVAWGAELNDVKEYMRGFAEGITRQQRETRSVKGNPPKPNSLNDWRRALLLHYDKIEELRRQKNQREAIFDFFVTEGLAKQSNHDSFIDLLRESGVTRRKS